ncbi:MAG: hypothetical protein K940chlam5_00959 [Candidatus Anoxychlamydiales bacterium]|nr:hypothetical protein [Candidatus Anoxychlamydiales bacterium]
MSIISSNKISDTLNEYSKQIDIFERKIEILTEDKTFYTTKSKLDNYIHEIEITDSNKVLSAKIAGYASSMLKASQLTLVVVLLELLQRSVYLDIAVGAACLGSLKLQQNTCKKLFDTNSLFQHLKEFKNIKRRFLRAAKIIKLNKITEKYKIAKIASISLLVLSLISTVSAVSIFISSFLLYAGITAAVATKSFSKNICGNSQKILKLQKENNFANNYKLYSNKLFYLKINSQT